MFRANELGIKTEFNYSDKVLYYLNKYNLPYLLKEVKSVLPNVELPDVDLDCLMSKLTIE